jgi:homeobox-leucine zipper protein
VAAQLGVAERQVAIWFQNRRARQRSKQMTQAFDLLKRDFRLVLMENKKMQQEVSSLGAKSCIANVQVNA